MMPCSFETVKLNVTKQTANNEIPLMRYRLYQYIIVINHYKDELYICENQVALTESELAVVESLIRSKDVPTFPLL